MFQAYADDCRIFTPEHPTNLFNNIQQNLDVYVVAHAIGWVIGIFLWRSWEFCMFSSIFYEFLEVSFTNWLPNFSECWWDVIFLDIFGCNLLGIIIGVFIMKYCKMKVSKLYDYFINCFRNIHGQKVKIIKKVLLETFGIF